MRRGRKPGRRAATIVEVALVISVCFLFLFGIVEYGRFIMTQQVMNNAAREGARYAVVNTQNATTTNVQTVVNQKLAGQGAQLSNFNSATNIQVFKADPATMNALDANNNVVTDWTLAPFTNAQFGQGVAVRITGTYTPVLPSFLFLGQSINMNATCLMYSEAN